MSGRQLPNHLGRNAASFCASQLAKTTILTPAFYASKWCSRPGFLDPFEVVSLCVRRLRQETYVNVRYVRRNDEKISDKSQLCPGLLVYFRELKQDAKVQEDLNEHISRGSVSHLRFEISRYRLDQVLLFLLKYIRERGALLKINYTTQDYLQRACSRSSSLAIAFLTGGYHHEFEHESMVVIGSYLSYLITVACAHDLFWVHSFLAEVWGPLLLDFVNIGTQLSETMNEDQLCKRRISFMARLLDSMPWDSLKPCESLRLTLGSEPEEQDLLRHEVELNRHVAQLQERPPALVNSSNICAFLDGQLPELAGASSRDKDQYLEAMNEKMLRDELERQENDQLRGARKAANRDYSDQYMYSEQHRALHAPNGMCPRGV